MKALLDFDVLVYECGFGVMTGWEGESPPPFDKAAELLDNRIANIVALSGADEYQGYLTGKGNFRERIAVSRPYKGNRLQEKPFHYKNLRAYMQGKYNAIIVDGMEADDAMAIEQHSDYINSYKIANGLVFEEKDAQTLNTIICTRDKDLRQVPGLLYSWELGSQPSYGPTYQTEEQCDKFFYKQCLTGDRVDNIGGVPGIGPKKAEKILKDCKSRDMLYSEVLIVYQHYYGDLAEQMLMENARLLFMVRETEEDWIKMWSPPTAEYEEWLNVNTREIKRTSKL